eukprot:620799-Rhodomonas_salina.3
MDGAPFAWVAGVISALPHTREFRRDGLSWTLANDAAMRVITSRQTGLCFVSGWVRMAARMLHLSKPRF